MSLASNRLKITKGSDWSAVYEWLDGSNAPVNLTGARFEAALELPGSKPVSLACEIVSVELGQWRVLVRALQSEALATGVFTLRARVVLPGNITKVFTVKAEVRP